MLTTWAILLGAIYLAYAGALFLAQRSLLFPATGWPAGARTLPPGVEAVEIPAAHGRVRLLYRRASGDRPAPAILYLHGNAEFAHQNLGAFAALARRGVHVALLEYPGYAGADGAPRIDSLREAVTRGYDWLAQRAEVDRTRIVAIGRSVGSGPALELTAHRPVRAVVLLSPFSSIAAFARARGLPGWLVRDRFDNVARASAYAGPVLVLHGDDDEIIPTAHGRAVAAAAVAGEFAAYRCGHNDCPWFEPEFDRRLQAFLRQHGVVDDPGSGG